MKKILISITALFFITTQGLAQKFIDVYQNNNVASSLFSEDIDSIVFTGKDVSKRRINFWRAGNIVDSFIVNDVDSLKVFRYEDEPLVYLGILGFNQKLYTKDINILTKNTSDSYCDFVKNLTLKNGTLLYYGVDKALDMLTQYNFTTSLSSVNLITFTDGLDQGSLMMTTDYQNDEEYLSYLNHRISTTQVHGHPLTAYCLGLRGNDITNYNLFQTNIRQLATSDDKAIELNNMSDVQNSLKEISDQIISISNRQNISMKVPGQSDETHICFTFDGKSPDKSSMYIDGIFSLSNRSLHDVTYYGLRSTSGNIVEGTQDGIFVTYTFTGLQRTDGNGLIPTNNIYQYNLAKGSTIWQINSEFRPDNNTQTTITHSGAVIMLVLDCSNSLGSQFSSMKNYATDFISNVANNAADFSINPPSNVTATIDDDMRVYVSWSTVKYAEYYSVYRSNYPNSNFSMIADSINVTNWCDEYPLQGNNYYLIYAWRNGLTSTASQTVVAERPMCPDNNHPHMIDLGLPSGTKWACCNVDTDNPSNQCPTNNGGYYAWGETGTKPTYDWSTYVHCEGTDDTCYDLSSNITGTNYDVAHVKWGGEWQMPTYDQFKELINNCYYELTMMNGVKGGKYTSKNNGAAIFLPSAYNHSSIGNYNSIGKGTYSDSFFGYTTTVDIYQNTEQKNVFRIYGMFDPVNDGNADEYLQITIMTPGTVLRDQTVTQEGIIYYNDTNTGYRHSTYDADILLCHPVGFTSTMDVSMWGFNRVLNYQADGTPGQVQLAPFYYMKGVGAWNYSQKDGVIDIIFPGYDKQDYTMKLDSLKSRVDSNNQDYDQSYITMGADLNSVKKIFVDNIYDIGADGSYWSSTLAPSSLDNAYSLYFMSYTSMSTNNRCRGQNVRPVAK